YPPRQILAVYSRRRDSHGSRGLPAAPAGDRNYNGGLPVANMAAAVNHANNYWYRSCADGDVWTPNAPVNANRDCAARGLNPAEWGGGFLNYERPGSLAEGLFLIPAAIGHPAIIKARDFMARNFPDRHFLCSWSDSKKDTFEGQTPPYTGLNDCSHFVSE